MNGRFAANSGHSRNASLSDARRRDFQQAALIGFYGADSGMLARSLGLQGQPLNHRSP